MNPASWHLQARRELFKASAFYDAESAGLGDVFLDEVERALDRLKPHPPSHVSASRAYLGRARAPSGARCYPEAVVPESPTEMTKHWIVSRPEVLGGKPCIRGTRISVELLLELLASGATHEEILKGYPQLTRQGLQAAFEYAARGLRNEIVWELQTSA